MSSDTTILDALKKLYAGHYLHLPVTVGLTPVGLVDVQQLTMAMLNYLMKKEYSSTPAQNSEGNAAGISHSSGPESGPMVKKTLMNTPSLENNVIVFFFQWTRFWNSTLAAAPESTLEGGATNTIEVESDRQSVSSTDGKSPLSPCRSQQSLSSPRATRSSMARTRRKSEEQQSKPTIASQKFVETVADGMFPFKVKDNVSGRIFRLTASYTDYASFSSVAFAKAGIQDLDDIALRRFSYEDDEGDIVFVDCDKSLEEAVNVAKRCRLVLINHYC